MVKRTAAETLVTMLATWFRREELQWGRFKRPHEQDSEQLVHPWNGSEAFTAQTVQEQGAPGFATLRTGVLVLWPKTTRGSLGLGSVEESVGLGRRSPSNSVMFHRTL